MDDIEWFQKFVSPGLTFEATLVCADGKHCVVACGKRFYVEITESFDGQFYLDGEEADVAIRDRVTLLCADHVIATQFDRIDRLRDVVRNVATCPHCPSCRDAASAVLEADGAK